VKRVEKRKLAFRYRVDRVIRDFVMTTMLWLTPAANEQRLDSAPGNIKRILIVRSIFRMGDTILASPAILLLRKNFPAAKIDFVGSCISKALFKNMPIGRHFEVYRSFPRVIWSYWMLLRKIRSEKYDLALDASGSSAALGSFIVGFSAARLRVGSRGKWDRWFNIRLDRPQSKNKYRILPALIASLGLESRLVYPRLFLRAWEIKHGAVRMREQIGSTEAPVVGIFVGGRKSRGKRWSKERFVELARRQLGAGGQPVIFVGPEEKDLLAYFRRKLEGHAPIMFEPDVRAFASLIVNCDLFVACDSGPVHLACALRVRTVAIFVKDDFDHWGPPPDLARVVHGQGIVSVDAVFEACRHELRCLSLSEDKFRLDSTEYSEGPSRVHLA
jgi:ADP-heptose:LPS heptosyltransferase